MVLSFDLVSFVWQILFALHPEYRRFFSIQKKVRPMAASLLSTHPLIDFGCAAAGAAICSVCRDGRLFFLGVRIMWIPRISVLSLPDMWPCVLFSEVLDAALFSRPSVLLKVQFCLFYFKVQSTVQSTVVRVKLDVAS